MWKIKQVMTVKYSICDQEMPEQNNVNYVVCSLAQE